jgi:hypothetical protein
MSAYWLAMLTLLETYDRYGKRKSVLKSNKRCLGDFWTYQHSSLLLHCRFYHLFILWNTCGFSRAFPELAVFRVLVFALWFIDPAFFLIWSLPVRWDQQITESFMTGERPTNKFFLTAEKWNGLLIWRQTSQNCRTCSISFNLMFLNIQVILTHFICQKARTILPLWNKTRNGWDEKGPKCN